MTTLQKTINELKHITVGLILLSASLAITASIVHIGTRYTEAMMIGFILIMTLLIAQQIGKAVLSLEQ